MDLPADQRLLYRDLVAKLDSLDGEPALIAFMAAALGSLLRRRGDAEFLRAVQDAFTTGLANRSWAEQLDLARQVIGLVITKRPEVALAWQTLHNEQPHPQARRAADQGAVPPVPELDDLPDFSLTPDQDEEVEAAASPGDFARAEELVAEDVSAVLARRLALFAVPEQRSPSPTYCHEQPFFLLAPQFGAVLTRFLRRAVLPLVRDELTRDVYAQVGPTADDDALKAALIDRRADIWTIIAAGLGRAARQQRSAEAKLLAVENGKGKTEYRTVEVPVSHPRVLTVLGVSFTLGHQTGVKTTRVPVKAAPPDADEMAALDLLARLRDMAARSGLELPGACDLELVKTLFEFDAQRLAEELPGLIALVGNEDTPREVLFERIDAVFGDYPPALAEAIVITLFHHGNSGAFGFEELHSLAVRKAEAGPVPFLLAEIARRPRDLAFQIRDLLRARAPRNGTGLAVVMLFEVWRVMDRSRFGPALDAALTVFSAFSVAFAGDRDETLFSEIGVVLVRALGAETLDAAHTIETVLRLYAKARV